MNMTEIINNAINTLALQQALAETEDVIGKKYINLMGAGITPSQHRRNVSLFGCRNIKAVIKPGATVEVQRIVKIFNQHKTGTCLHTISTGRNWGLGSSEPSKDGIITVALDRMAAMRELNIKEGWAIIEPGVTQLTLTKALEGSERMFNVTASSGHTSVVGNIVERGVGLRRQRTEDLLGLEVITPTGELVHVGWWPDEERSTAFNPLGHGPSLLHLYTQSNLGIVTAAVVRLLPRPEEQKVLRLRFRREVLQETATLLKRWYAQELISGVLKIYDAVSTESYGGAAGEHLALLCVSGTVERVNALSSVLMQEAQRSGFFTSISHSGEALKDSNDFVMQVVEHAYAGDPSWNEHMLRSATGTDADRVDAEGGGWIFFLALIPFNGPAISQALAMIDDIYTQTGIHAGTTVNALSSDVIDLVVSIKFSPVSDDISRAHKTLDLMYELFTKAGFYPYRLDIDHADYCDNYYSKSEREMNKRMKKFMDPNNIIAAGRYA